MLLTFRKPFIDSNKHTRIMAAETARASPSTSSVTSNGTSHKRKRPGDAPKYYAVRQGRIPGVYNTWEECLNQIKGHKGALCKLLPALNQYYPRPYPDNLQSNRFLLLPTPKLSPPVKASQPQYQPRTRQGSRNSMLYKLVVTQVSTPTGTPPLSR